MKEQQKQIIEDYIRSYNNLDVAGMLQDLAEDIIFENVVNDQVQLRTEGLAAFKEQAEAALAYFRERRQSVINWTFADESVIVQIDYEAVLAIDLPNGMQAGESLNLQGESIFEFQEGKIKRITDKS